MLLSVVWSEDHLSMEREAQEISMACFQQPTQFKFKQSEHKMSSQILTQSVAEFCVYMTNIAGHLLR